jgi:hypothetical protein
MARALDAGELTYLRSEGQHSRLFLAIDVPDVMCTAQVNGAPSSNDQVYEITYDNASEEAYVDAIPGQTVLVGSTEGACDKGIVRLRGTLPDTSGTVKIGETSKIDWADDDYLTILDDFSLWARHIYIDGGGNVYMDRDIAYSDQHEDCDPVPVLGPDAVAWLTGETVDVEFDASDSWVVGSNISAYSWSSMGCDSIDGDTTATPTITYSLARRYRVSCEVTAANGKSFTGYRRVFVFDDENPPTTAFRLNSCSGDYERGGWRYSVTLYDAADFDAVRDRAYVILFARDWYGGDEVSIGPVDGRENILCAGWISGESITWDVEQGTVTFEVCGPQAYFNAIPGFPMGVEDCGESPDVWTEFEDLTVDRGLFHFLHWRTTATLLMDVRVTGDEREILAFEAPLASLWHQMQAAAEGAILARPLCDRYGRLFVEVDTQYMPSRVSVPTVQALTSVDWIGQVDIDRIIVPEVGQVNLSGALYSGGTGIPLFSLSPGHVPYDTGDVKVMDNLALSGQSQANTLAGLALGRERNEYPEFNVNLASNHRACDICPVQYLTLTVAEGDTLRGIELTNHPIVPRSISFNYDHSTGVLLTSIRAEGQTDELESCDGDLPACIPVASLPAITVSIVEPQGVVYAGQDGGGVQVRSHAGSWSAYNTGLSGDALTVYDLAIDAETMGEGLASLTAYICTEGGLYKTTTGGGSWSKLTLDEPEEGMGEPDVACVKVVNGSVYVLAHLSAEEKVWLYLSVDGGTTWNWAEVVVNEATLTLEDSGGASDYDKGRKLIPSADANTTAWAIDASGSGTRYRDNAQTWHDFSESGEDLDPNIDIFIADGRLVSVGDDGAANWDDGASTPSLERFIGCNGFNGGVDILTMPLIGCIPFDQYGGGLAGYFLEKDRIWEIWQGTAPPDPCWYYFAGYVTGWPEMLPTDCGNPRFIGPKISTYVFWLTTDSKIYNCERVTTDHGGGNYSYDITFTEEWSGASGPTDSIFEFDGDYFAAHYDTALLKFNGVDSWDDDGVECTERIVCGHAWDPGEDYSIAVGTDTGVYILNDDGDAYIRVANLANVRRIICIVEDDEYYILALTPVGIYRIGPLPGTAFTFFVPEDGRAHLMDVDCEGAYVYFGLIDDGDLPVLIRAAADLSSFEAILYSGTGTWGGVTCDLWDADKLWTFGDWGASIKVEYSESNGNAWTNQTNGDWGAGEVVAWVVQQAFDGDDLLAMLSDAEEVWRSENGGTLWRKRGDAPFASRCGVRGMTFFELEIAWMGFPTDDTAVVATSDDDGKNWETDQPNGTGTLVLRKAITVEQGAVGQTLDGYCE